MSIEVGFGNHYWATTSVPVNEGRCLWYQEVKMPRFGAAHCARRRALR
jgi:hypothetical protein